MASNTITLTNLIPNSSFEDSSGWGGVTYSTAHALFGTRSSELPSGTVQVNSVATTAQPILNHKYYGRHYIKTLGNSTPADCRFEWYAGDGVGLNWVFGTNGGDHQNWYMESSIQTVDIINGSNYVIRNFVVDGTYNCYCDGLMLIDLTASFGSGGEPTKEWCDANISFFSGTMEIRSNLISPNRIKELKSRAKAECARRNSTGSVSSYAGTAYDFSLIPAAGVVVKKEHYEKTAVPLNAINSTQITKVSAENSVVKDSDFVTMETFLTVAESRNKNDKSGTDCSASCTGMCYSCTGTCEGTCTGCTGCTSCTGCSGCGTGCATGCSGCGSGCANTCEGWCTDVCTGCKGGCSMGCLDTCFGCTGTCSLQCTGTSK